MSWKSLLKRVEVLLKRSSDVGILVFFACFSTAFRLFQIGQRDFWYDEAYTGNLIRLPWKEVMPAIVYDIHPPLYYVLLKLYALVMGDGVVMLRSFSAIFGVGGVLLVYLIGKELYSRKTAVYAAFLASVSPFLIQFSQEARMYSAYAFFILLAFYLFLKALRTRRWSYAIGWNVCLSLACLTHYMAFVFFPCFLIVEIMHEPWSWQNIKRSLAGSALGLLIFVPWLPHFVEQLSHAERWTNPPATQFSDIFLTLEIFLIGMPKGEMSAGAFLSNQLRGLSETGVFLWIQGIAVSLMGYVVIVHERRKGMALGVFSFGVLFLAYALHVTGHAFLFPRYVMPAAFFLCLLMAAWLSRLPRWGVGAFFFVFLVLLALVRPVANSEGYNALQEHLSVYEGAHFYSLNTFDYMIAKYYLGGPERLTLYNSSWPQFDSRSWPMMGRQTKRTERLDDLKEDPRGIIIRNVQVPLQFRDDKNFDPTPFQLVATYKNIELYANRR